MVLIACIKLMTSYTIHNTRTHVQNQRFFPPKYLYLSTCLSENSSLTYLGECLIL